MFSKRVVPTGKGFDTFLGYVGRLSCERQLPSSDLPRLQRVLSVL
jgi:hypothetical protein